MPDQEQSQEEIIEYFQARIAGKNIEIECKYRDVFRYCRNYLAKFETPDLVLPLTTEEDLRQERLAAIATDKAEGRAPGRHTDANLETLVVCRKLANSLLGEGFVLFHGAAIAAGDRCYLFMAKSGTGKTTHIKKWLKLHPETYVVNGDKPLIDLNRGLVYGTPWCGKEGLGTNTAAALGGLVQLERGAENEITPMSFSEMLPCLMRQCHIPPGATAQVLRLLAKLQGVPCWRLQCNMEDAAGELSYAALTK